MVSLTLKRATCFCSLDRGKNNPHQERSAPDEVSAGSGCSSWLNSESSVMKFPRSLWRSRRLFWSLTVIVFLSALGVSLWLLGTPPPKRIKMATGDPHGGFASLGELYKDRLDRLGLEVQLLPSSGSLDNLSMLRQQEAHVAFVQGGLISSAEEEVGLAALAAIGSEPLWIFTHTQANSLVDLRGKRIALGPAVSGTDALGRLLLGQYGVTEDKATFLNGTMNQSRQAFMDRTADALLLVCSASAPVIQELVASPEPRIISLGHQRALVRRYRYLRDVTLPKGTLDLQRGLPAEDTAMVAPVTMLVAREDLHPRVVEQLLLTARALHSAGDLFDEHGQFPTLEGVDLPVHFAAERFMRSGESFLSRLLPYHLMRWLWRAQLLILPLLALVPLWRAFPLLYSFRINQIRKHHYVALREIEDRIEGSSNPEQIRQAITDLEGLRKNLEKLSSKLPTYLQNEVYTWRMHVAMVRDEARDRLRQLLGLGLYADDSSSGLGE